MQELRETQRTLIEAGMRFTNDIRLQVEAKVTRIPWKLAVNTPGAVILQWFTPFSERGYWLITAKSVGGARGVFTLSKYSSSDAPEPYSTNTLKDINEALDLADDEYSEALRDSYLHANTSYRLTFQARGEGKSVMVTRGKK